jgi:hypothetical protein
MPEGSQSEPGTLISEMRAHNDTLREQLEAERQAHAEARRLLAAALERIPAIEAPQEPSEAPTAPSEPVPYTETPPEAERVPWWRRWFGEG